MRHESFEAAELRDGVLLIDERLSWITGPGQTWIEERRRIGVSVLPGGVAWRLSFATAMHNVSGGLIPIGSPPPDGGAWGWAGGAPGGGGWRAGRGRWLGSPGHHDGHGRVSTLLFCDRAENFSFPSQWFVRTGIYACAWPAPFFGQEYPLAAGQTLALGYDVLVADGALDAATCGQLARQAAALDVWSAA